MTDTSALLMDQYDEHAQMEAALRAIRDRPDKAFLIADTTLQLVDANRSLRLDLLASNEESAS